MRSKTAWILSALLVLACFGTRAFAVDREIEQLKTEVATLQDRLKILEDAAKAPAKSAADVALDNKYGPNQQARTAQGKLQLGGLVQVWYYHIQNDHYGLFNNFKTGVMDTNDASDSDSFRIRRAEMTFTMDIHENVSAFVMIDPAAEAASFPQLGVATKRLANVSPDYNDAYFNMMKGVGAPLTQTSVVPGSSEAAVANLQKGARTASPTLLQDALINFHCLIPHHDFTIGQMKSTFNHEAFGDDGKIDFAERTYIGNVLNRDMGAVVHGSWWDNERGNSYQGSYDPGRFQYWLGVWNSSGNLYGTGTPEMNASDDNDQKDFIGTTMVRPVWNDCWGDLELGYSFRYGHHGKSGLSGQDGGNGNSFVMANTPAFGHDAYLDYDAPGMLKGLWVKGEAMWIKDRNVGGSVINLNGAESFQLGVFGAGPFAGSLIAQPELAGQPQAFSTFGYWGAVGYKFKDAPWMCTCDRSFWRNFEVEFRYESAPNVWIAKPNQIFTDVYSTKVYTSGVNYYICGDRAKIQFDYNHLQNPRGPNGSPFHNTKDDSFILNFQVMW